MRFRPGTVPFTLFLGALGALPALSTDMGLPALGPIGDSLGVTPAAAALTLSVFMVGFAIGPLAYGPISDRFGRRPVLLGGGAVFALGGVACALAPNLPLLLLARAVQGSGAAAGLVMAFAIVRDLYEGAAARAQLSWVSVVMNVAPMISPTIGAALLAGGWRLIYAVMAAFGAALLLAVLLGFAESARPQTGGMLRRVGPAYRQVLTTRASLGYVLVNALSFGNLFAYITGAPLLLIGTRGVSPQSFSLLFALAAVGLIVGATASGRMARRNVPERWPLLIGLAIALGASALLLLTGAAAPLPVVVVLLVANALTRGLIGPNATHGALRPLPQIAGSASAMLGFVQMLTGAMAGALVSALSDFYPQSAMAVVMTAFAIAAMVIWVLVVPAAVRETSRAAT